MEFDASIFDLPLSEIAQRMPGGPERPVVASASRFGRAGDNSPTQQH